MQPVTIAAEGDLDVAVARVLLQRVGLHAGPEYVLGGKPKLDAKLQAYNNAARFGRWLVLRDLNSDAPCAGQLVGQLLAKPAEHMRFRIAVRTVESWLLADRDSLGDYLSVSRAILPTSPEVEANPKQTMLIVIARSRSSRIQNDMLPASGISARIGPLYNARLIEFVQNRWRPNEAAKRAPSLARAMTCLEQWATLTDTE